MKRIGFLLVLFACLGLVDAVAQPSVQEIIEKADQLMRGDTQSGIQEMIIVRPDWERSMRFEFSTEGTEKAFIRVLEPAKDRGVAFLKINREMWQYVPRINRVIKIPPSMMLQSWMGSDLTNDDLVKESSIVDDYTHTLLGQETLDGDDTYKIELIPKPETAVAWDRIIEWIRADDYIPLKAVYFNERGEQIRTMIFSDIKEIGGRILPTRIELIEEKKPGHKTVLITEEATFDRPINRSVFTQQNLRRAK